MQKIDNNNNNNINNINKKRVNSRNYSIRFNKRDSIYAKLVLGNI
jgi:hypothetical protein